MNTVTLAQLKSRVRTRCDMENSNFITDAELLIFINESYGELYDILVSRFEDYHTTTGTITVSAGSDNASLPSSFYKLRGIDRQVSTNNYYTLKKFNFSNRNLYDRNRRLYTGAYAVQYRIVGTTVYFMPKESAPGTYRIWYVPEFTPLSSDSDTVNSVNEWSEYIVVDSAIKCLAKEESSTTHLERERQRIMDRIENMAQNRDFDQPERVTDVRNIDYPEYL